MAARRGGRDRVRVGDGFGRPLEDLQGTGDVEALHPVEQDDEDAACSHAASLAAEPEGGNDGYPTFPAIVARRVRAVPENVVLRS
ncbi:hypothetical protein GCM10022221_34010 [Actinocorallia aurea]